MNTKEHKKYLEEFSALTKKILSSEKETSEFLVEAGINTPTGRLTKIYSDSNRSIGYRTQKES